MIFRIGWFLGVLFGPIFCGCAALPAAESESAESASRPLSLQAQLADQVLSKQPVDDRRGLVMQITADSQLERIIEQSPDPELVKLACRRLQGAARRFDYAVNRPGHLDGCLIAIAFSTESEAELLRIGMAIADGPRASTAIGRIKDPALLKKAADEHPDAWLRNRLSARLRQLHTKSLVAEIKEIDDQRQLSEIALTGEADEVRSAAARRLQDPALLEAVALSSGDTEVIGIAAARIIDQSVLYDLVRSLPADDWDANQLRRKLTARIDNTDLLRSIALNDPDQEVVTAALRGVDDQTVLQQFARTGATLEQQLIAVCRLEDEAVLTELSQREPGRVGAVADLRLALLEANEVGSNAVLSAEVSEIFQSYIAAAAPASIAGERVTVSLKDQYLWQKEFSTQFPSSIGVGRADRGKTVMPVRIDNIEMIERLLGSHLREALPEAVRVELIDNASSVLLRAAALWSVSSNALALRAIESEHSLIRRVAVSRLDDQALLGRIAQHDAVTQVRIAAIRRLTDKGLLDELIQDAAAEVRTWAQLRRTELDHRERGWRD